MTKNTKNVGMRSPLFYVGDKYKLMPQLKALFPENINTFIDPFVGGGSTFLNTQANKYALNDLDRNVIGLHDYLFEQSQNANDLLAALFEVIEHYSLTCSLQGKSVPDELKRRFKKTYYAVANKDAYNKMRSDFNGNKSRTNLLYLLLIYGFNHMIRFNRNGDFNLPVGNVDFNKTVKLALLNYNEFVNVNKGNVIRKSQDYKEFLQSCAISKDDFVYLDPPYLITFGEYNKFWGEEQEKQLYAFLDILTHAGIRFGLSNMVTHKGNTNEILTKWMARYNVFEIKSNYISFHDNTIKVTSREVFITNYG
ncbi:MAG: Dam family site-specific DNA-(adenine-N6)-methyltransferase [Bifidobacteriaceae bacterium]|jgi:DNA adenine methylase|nr:Dam family site-specific DNA-(adenine-N6)-methyltransferase [Bifidobacteriaceae bacterium]